LFLLLLFIICLYLLYLVYLMLVLSLPFQFLYNLKSFVEVELCIEVHGVFL